MSFQEYFTNTIDVFRNTDVLFNSIPLPVNQSINTTYPRQDIVVEISVAAGSTANFTVTGSLNTTGVSEVLTFTGTAVTTKATSKIFSGLTSIVSGVGGSANSATIKLRTRAGQPVPIQSTVLTNRKCRIDSLRDGFLTLSSSGVRSADRLLLFIDTAKNFIQHRDLIIDVDSGEKYTVTDIDNLQDSFGHHHQEVVLDRT